MAGRFIKLYDKILQWEWYSDINTFRLFIHLLLKANYKDLNFEGQRILRGQLVTSLPKLSVQTGLTVRQIRVSLDKLKLTGEVTDRSCNRYRIITVVKYDDYQASDRQIDRQMTGEMAVKRQADDRQMTASIDNIEYIEQDRIKENSPSESKRKTASRFTPPAKEEILDFCLTEGYGIDVDRFYDYYESVGWKVGGKAPMKDWKAAVRNWASRDKKTGRADDRKQAPAKRVVAQEYSQRDYGDEDNDALQRMLRVGGYLP